jgi:hypothetical protein
LEKADSNDRAKQARPVVIGPCVRRDDVEGGRLIRGSPSGAVHRKARNKARNFEISASVPIPEMTVRD